MYHYIKNKASLLTVLLSLAGIIAFLSSLAQDTTREKETIEKLYKQGNLLLATNIDSARILFRQELIRSGAINYTSGIVSGYVNLSRTCASIGDYDESLQYLDTARIINNGNNKDNKLAIIYTGIANNYGCKGNFTEAATYYYKAIQLCEQNITEKDWKDSVNNVYFFDLVRCYDNIAAVFSRMNEYNKEIYYLRKAEQITRLKKNYEGLCYVLCNISVVLLSVNQSDSAEAAAQEALSISTQYGISVVKPNILMQLGDIYAKKNSLKAIQYYNEVLQSNIGFHEKVSVWLALAKFYMQTHKYYEAEKILLDTKDLAAKHNMQGQLVHTYDQLSDMYEAQKKYEKAFYARVELEKLNDSFTVAEREKNINLLDVKYHTAQKDKSIAENKLLIAQQQAKINRKNVLIAAIVIALIIIVCFSVLLYIHRQRMQAEKLKALKDEEKINMLLSVIKGEEKERNRLAGELHDGIGGLLSTVKMFFSNLQKKETSVAAYTDFNDAMKLLDETITEVRKTAHNLMPEILFNYGLPEAARLFCDTFQKANNVRVNFQYYGFIGRLNRNFELFIYRILQELLQNISKHANATEALVQISLHDNILSITIEDNGIGMVEKNGQEGMGLQIIKSRISDLDGQFIINSSKAGTSVYIEIDIKNQDKFTV